MKDSASRKQVDHRLARLVNDKQQHHLTGGLKGIEKESLRITPDGLISRSPHPKTLGSAMTHPHITTDYSEALLEFITPPFPEIEDTLSFLQDIHQFVYQNLNNEKLLATSMPCGISGDQSIPIANYGKSNVGRMKSIYRKGLGYRYGRTMQAIAGIHFNYSVAENFWPVFQSLEHNRGELKQFIAESYFGLIRNWRRYGWLILYLFGSSPAVCKSFLIGRTEFHAGFKEFDPDTLYKPFATSLRMSDIGYKSSNQADLKISYNSLDEYVATLTQAINTPFSKYQSIGIKVDGEYRQLNDCILQIENEYYSPVRPKQIAYSGEKPTLALNRRGVRYVEIRSLDINAFDTMGIDAEKLRFIEALVLLCLLQESPGIDLHEDRIIKANFLKVAIEGRDPHLNLMNQGNVMGSTAWANEICESMREICEILDNNSKEKLYSRALNTQLEAIKYAELTPSAKILEDMRSNKESFSSFALRMSNNNEDYFKSCRLDKEKNGYFMEKAQQSVAEQKLIEKSDTTSLDEFLDRYFCQ